jgi:hypothetical protein
MPIKTNMKSLQPRRQAFKREIQLLSKGFSAPEAWPEGKITVFPWDSDVDAYLMEKVNKGGRGNLLYGILEKVCNLNGASVDKFVFSEINGILLFSRALRFNGPVEYDSHCPHCHSTDKESIKIPEELSPIGEKEVGYKGMDSITLPGCKDVITLRPLLVADQKKIEDRAKNEWKSVPERVAQIVYPIVDINGGRPDTIEELITYYEALSPDDCIYLEEQEIALTPHLDTKIPHKCKECGKDFYHTLMFDQEFFRPGSR